MTAQPLASWRQSLLALTNSAESAEEFLDQRLLFTTAVAWALTKGEIGSALLYGVWLQGHDAPIYIGQTLEGKRRLWDLPIGESHHLSNSFPPEIWSRVVVVDWMSLLSNDFKSSPEEMLATQRDQFPHAAMAVGLALEHLLQKRFRPLFNQRKKKRDGRWRMVDWNSSKSIAARASVHVVKLFERVLLHWEQLASVPAEDTGCTVVDHGRVVFPAMAKPRE